MNNKPWMIAAFASWGIALSVFMPFAVLYMRVELKWDFLWAALCLMGAVYFMFRSHP